jgi:hypothetical protein
MKVLGLDSWKSKEECKRKKEEIKLPASVDFNKLCISHVNHVKTHQKKLNTTNENENSESK